MNRRYVKPWGWPFRLRRLYDTAQSTLVHQANIERWFGDPSAGYLLSWRTCYRESLYVTPRGRYFLLRGENRIKPMWRWQAKCWLLQHAAPPEIVLQHFLACYMGG
jgi:hypothetical protein